MRVLQRAGGGGDGGRWGRGGQRGQHGGGGRRHVGVEGVVALGDGGVGVAVRQGVDGHGRVVVDGVARAHVGFGAAGEVDTPAL